MHNHRMIRRPPFGREDLPHPRFVVGISAEAVDGFGRKSNEAVGTKYCGGLFNFVCRGHSFWHYSSLPSITTRSAVRLL